MPFNNEKPPAVAEGSRTDHHNDQHHFTTAARLASTHAASSQHGHLLVKRFQRLGVERWGLWWDWMLNSPEDELEDADRLWIETTWEQWLAGDNPFRRRRVAA